jgi:SnoaL-like domain
VQYKELTVDRAETETHAIAFVVVAAKAGDQIHMRSLRYLDRFVRIDDAWKICARAHTLDWRCEVPSSFALSFPQRLMAMPDALLNG